MARPRVRVKVVPRGKRIRIKHLFPPPPLGILGGSGNFRPDSVLAPEFLEGEMTVRKLAGFLPILLLLALARPLSAQAVTGIQWTMDRPDGYAPISITNDRTLAAGQIEIGLRFINDRFKGQGVETDSISVDEVLTMFDVAPTLMTARGAELNLLVGVTRHLTLSASGSFVEKKMDYLGGIEDEPNLLLYYQTTASGPQDVDVSALYNFYDAGPLRVHFHGGVSIPVGSIDATDETPGGSGDSQLPYEHQLGSGTFDILPGVTASVQSENASLGIQWTAEIRLGENDRGWALGDMYKTAIWAGFNATDWVSASMAVHYSRWGNVEGYDEDLDPFESPANNTLAQAGWRVDLPIGLNFVVPDGRFGGNRFGIQFLFPIHQNLDGPQLKNDWSIVVGWQKAFSF